MDFRAVNRSFWEGLPSMMWCKNWDNKEEPGTPEHCYQGSRLACFDWRWADLKMNCHIHPASAKMWMVQYFHLHCTIDNFLVFSSNNLFIRGKIKLYTAQMGCLMSQPRLKRSDWGKVSVSNLYLYAWLDSTIRQFHLAGANFPLDIHKLGCAGKQPSC